MTWQPISTAPKDGTPVDIYVRDQDGDGRREAFVWYAKDPDGWYCAHIDQLGSNRIDVRLTPTHWMPLPEPPTPE